MMCLGLCHKENAMEELNNFFYKKLFYKHISDKFRHPMDRYAVCVKFHIYTHNALLDYKLKKKN